MGIKILGIVLAGLWSLNSAIATDRYPSEIDMKVAPLTFIKEVINSPQTRNELIQMKEQGREGIEYYHQFVKDSLKGSLKLPIFADYKKFLDASDIETLIVAEPNNNAVIVTYRINNKDQDPMVFYEPPSDYGQCVLIDEKGAVNKAPWFGDEKNDALPFIRCFLNPNSKSKQTIKDKTIDQIVQSVRDGTYQGDLNSLPQELKDQFPSDIISRGQ